jgi:hypothetical protein
MHNMYVKPQGFRSATIFYGVCVSLILPERVLDYVVDMLALLVRKIRRWECEDALDVGKFLARI